jgi:hypothetical protein
MMDFCCQLLPLDPTELAQRLRAFAQQGWLPAFALKARAPGIAVQQGGGVALVGQDALLVALARHIPEQWTNQRPEQPGWYWAVRYPEAGKGPEAEVVLLQRRNGEASTLESGVRLASSEGPPCAVRRAGDEQDQPFERYALWLGPLALPPIPHPAAMAKGDQR